MKRKFILIIPAFLWLMQFAVAQEAYIGQIVMFAGNFAPRGWALCNGQLLSISQNTALFSILGTTYGGDGRTTFALPNLNGRAPVGKGQGPGLSNYNLGKSGGASTVTLTVAELPAHSHLLNNMPIACDNQTATSNSPANNIPAKILNGTKGYNTSENAVMHDSQINLETGFTGSGQAHNNMKPYLAVNYIICLYGIYPPRY